jgi:hypothetical protein
MPDLYVYRTRNQAALTAFRRAAEELESWLAELNEAAADLGNNRGPYATTSPMDGTWDLHGLEAPEAVAAGKADPPAGWRYVRSRKRLEPERGKAGIYAREWMARHRMPDEAAVRPTLARYGLPTHHLAGHRVVMPSIEILGGALWATAGAELPTCTWERVRVSDYYLARGE